MKRQSKEESQTMWKLELETAKALELIPEHKALVDTVTVKIDDYSLTYDEYVKDIADYLESVGEDANPKEVIVDMCNYLIQKYNGEEIRSEQD